MTSTLVRGADQLQIRTRGGFVTGDCIENIDSVVLEAIDSGTCCAFILIGKCLYLRFAGKQFADAIQHGVVSPAGHPLCIVAAIKRLVVAGDEFFNDVFVFKLAGHIGYPFVLAATLAAPYTLQGFLPEYLDLVPVRNGRSRRIILRL